MGIDEDYVRAQAMIEPHWHQDCPAAHGGSGCNEGGDLNNPGGYTNRLPVTPLTPDGQFYALQGFGGIEAPPISTLRSRSFRTRSIMSG